METKLFNFGSGLNGRIFVDSSGQGFYERSVSLYTMLFFCYCSLSV